MEDVLEQYHFPYDPKMPLVCMDETSKQLVGEMKVPLQPRRGRLIRHDYEYERNGTANVFMFTEPLKNRRWVAVTEQRTAEDWAHQIKELVDVRYPTAPIIRLVMDNLNTHSKASLYKAFSPAEARRIAHRLEIHHTPKHGSWLNIAEIELRVLSIQCLDRRMSNIETLRREVAAWQASRNGNEDAQVDWQFSVQNARIKLKRLYPRLTSAPKQVRTILKGH